jgi:hypothetical protein
MSPLLGERRPSGYNSAPDSNACWG